MINCLSLITTNRDQKMNHKYLQFPFNAPLITLITAYLSRSYLDVEVAPLIGDLEDLWPCEAVDPQPVTVNEQTVGANAQHYLNPFRILQ